MEEGSKAKEEEYTRVSSQHQKYPWLILSDGENSERQLFYSVEDDLCYEKHIPELQNDYITCSTHKQWLVVEDKVTSDSFLVNISTMEKVKIPPLLNRLSESNLCALLSSSPVVDGTCRLVFLDMDDLSNFFSCKLGDTEFKKHERLDNTHIFGAALNFKGKLHVVTWGYFLMSADYSDPDLLFQPIITHSVPAMMALYGLLPLGGETERYLVESSGDLLLIYTRYRDGEFEDLKILRADLILREWVFIENLGDQAIFLDSQNSFSSPASVFGLKGNCVYFVNAIGRNLFVYDLEDESLSMSLPCPTVSFDSSLTWMQSVLDISTI